MARRRKMSVSHASRHPARQSALAVSASTPTHRRTRVRVALALAAVAALLYVPSIFHGFVGDDAFVIANNAWTREGVSALPRVVSHSLYFGAVPLNGGLYRPVAGAYYVIVGALIDLRPTGYHLAQVGLYALNAAIVFLFLTRLKRGAIAIPAVATLLFVVHPIHTEVVNNIKSADEMLCLAFFLTAASAWLVYADTLDRRWRAVSLMAYALALGSKETAVAMLVVLPALWYFFRGRSAAESLRGALPFAGLAALYLGIRHVVLSAEPATPIVTLLNNSLLASNEPSVQLASAFAFVVRYLWMLVWPYPLSFDYSYNAIPLKTFGDPVVWMALVVCAGVAAILVAGLRRRRLESFASLWLVASLVLVSNVPFLISTNFGERLLYLPSVIACYVMASAFFVLARKVDEPSLAASLRSPILVAALLVVVIPSSALVVARTREWRDESTLFAADLAKYPNSARLNSYLGNVRYMEGDRLVGRGRDVDTAAAHFSDAKRLLLRKLEINSTFTETDAVLGMAEFQLRQYREAIPHLEQALRFPALRPIAFPMMGQAYEELGDTARAIETFEKIDAEGIEYPHGWFVLGNDAAARGDDDRSIHYFNRVVTTTPDNATAYVNLALAHSRKGNVAQAMTVAEACLTVDAKQVYCLLLAAQGAFKAGDPKRAATYIQRAESIDPTHPWLRR